MFLFNKARKLIFNLRPHAFSVFHMVRFTVYSFITGIRLVSSDTQITGITILRWIGAF